MDTFEQKNTLDILTDNKAIGYISGYSCDIEFCNSNIQRGIRQAIEWTTTLIRISPFVTIEVYYHSLSPNNFQVFISYGNTWEYKLSVPVEQMGYIFLRRLVRGSMEQFGDNYHAMMFNANRNEKLHIDFIGTFTRQQNTYR